jgi:hypothetical protein
MTDIFEEKSSNETSRRMQVLLPFVSTIFGGAALWYAWIRYNTILNRPDLYWYDWIQLAAILLVGILCVSATFLFLLSRPSGVSVFKIGISIVPLLLFSNLVMLVFRVIQNVIRGDASLFFDRLFSQPHKFILIPIVVIILIWLDSLIKSDKSNH